MIFLNHIQGLSIPVSFFSYLMENKKTQTLKNIPNFIERKFKKNIISCDHNSPFYEERMEIPDIKGELLFNANIPIQFTIQGSGEPVEKENEDPLDRNIFNSHNRCVFDRLALTFFRPKDKLLQKFKHQHELKVWKWYSSN